VGGVTPSHPTPKRPAVLPSRAVRALIRWFFEALVRLYYPVIAVAGRAHLPAGASLLFVANHPNALLDPLVLRVALGLPIRFLGKSTLFAHPLSRLTMEAFGGIPVYRPRDAPAGGGDASQNERTFALCRAALARGEPMALFPEGTSHSDPELRPLKTGAARIALSARAEHGPSLALAVVPAGLHYDRKTVFRSRVLVAVGEPIAVEGFAAAYARDEAGAVRSLTDAIRAGIAAVVTQADTRALLEGVASVAAWTGDPDARDDLAARQARAHLLLQRYAALQARDPARAEEIVALASQYMRVLQSLGVADPWALEVGRVTAGAALRAVLGLAALAPFALVGALLAWAPYRLAGRVARTVTREEDELGTVKAMAGALFVLAAWLAEAALVGWRLGALAGLALLVVAPACGYAALRFEERAEVAAEALRHAWIRARRPGAAVDAVRRRRALADAVSEALRDSAAGDV
jgi:glycerol-3-phosphate O-acyltransferase/dihydroxyacetone phosphate acyltransferase